MDIQFQYRLVREYGRGRCWLVGDAAHQTAPAGIQSMNVGFLEAEDLSGKLVQVIRRAGAEPVLTEYDRSYRDEWRLLLGGKGAPRPGTTTKPWVGQYAGQILASLPASGPELGLLLAQLGLSLP